MLETDKYKLSMGNFVFNKYPNVRVKVKFFDRNQDHLGYMAPYLQEMVYKLCQLRMTPGSDKFLATQTYLSDDYVEWLMNVTYQPSEVKIENVNGQLEIMVSGLWHEVMHWETHLLPIISQKFMENKVDVKDVIESTKEMVARVNEWKLNLILMGLRRRAADWVEDYVSYSLKDCPTLVGVSNAYIAWKYNMSLVGTIAHEMYQTMAALVEKPYMAQYETLKQWAEFYKDQPSMLVALTDTYSTQAFWQDFDEELANIYWSLREDSSLDPFVFGEEAIHQYEKRRIDSKTKLIIFSNNLDLRKAHELQLAFEKYFKKVLPGIGGNTTNCFSPTFKKPNIVFKVIEANDMALCKLSDDPGKEIGTEEAKKPFKDHYKLNR